MKYIKGMLPSTGKLVAEHLLREKTGLPFTAKTNERGMQRLKAAVKSLKEHELNYWDRRDHS